MVPWSIDNKYYTANVNFQLLELEDDGAIPSGVEVLIYLFDSVSHSSGFLPSAKVSRDRI